MANRITLEVTRYHPAHDEKPRFETFEVPLRKEWVVLDALNYIKDHLDGSLTFRWSCRMGVCGSCGMTVNGVPKLTCATFLSDYAPGPVRVEPMRNFPVLRDLVVDTSDFLVKLAKSKPWIIRDVEKPLEEEYFQTPEQLEAYKQFSMCINCMLCYAACPVTAWTRCSVDPRPLPWLSGTTWTPGPRRQRAPRYPRITMESGGAHLSASVQRFALRMWTPPAPFSNTS